MIKISTLLAPFQMFRLNYFCRNIVRRERAKLVPYRKSVFVFKKTARLIIGKNLATNVNCFKRNGRSTLIRIDGNATMEVRGSFEFYHGCDVIIFWGGNLQLHGGYCNINTKIRCSTEITIGEGAAIAHDVTIQDFDAHELWQVKEDGTEELLPSSSPIHIGKHVWIGTKATVLKGVTIGDGAVIAAGAVVTRDVPPACLAAGAPARVIKENVQWK